MGCPELGCVSLSEISQILGKFDCESSATSGSRLTAPSAYRQRGIGQRKHCGDRIDRRSAVEAPNTGEPADRLHVAGTNPGTTIAEARAHVRRTVWARNTAQRTSVGVANLIANFLDSFRELG